MRTVYEKTLALLFRGQKNIANNNAETKLGKGIQYVYSSVCTVGICAQCSLLMIIVELN